MKVLIVGAANPIPSFIEARIRALIARSVDVWVLYDGDRSSNIEGSIGVRIGRPGSIPSFVKDLAIIISSPLAFGKLMSFRPELGFLMRLRWAAKYFKVTRIPRPDVVHFQWVTNASEFKWLRYYFDCPFIASARGSQVTIYPRTRKGYSEILENAFRTVDFVHCVSYSIMKACLQFGLIEKKGFVNYNGVDLRHFQRRYDYLPQGSEFVIVSIGALMWRKAFGYQLIVLSHLLKSYPQVRLIWIGDGPDIEGLKYLAHRLDCLNSLEFAGSVRHDDIPIWLSRADAYLSTSAAEGLSNGMVEAAACSLPLVSFECEGVNEVVESGYNGFVVPFGDINGMISCFVNLIEDRSRCLQMGTNSRQLAESRFDEKEQVSKMIELLSTIAVENKVA